MPTWRRLCRFKLQRSKMAVRKQHSTVSSPRSSISSQSKRPAHWVNDKGTAFVNPWDSYKVPAFWPLFKFVRQVGKEQRDDPDFERANELVPQVKPDFGINEPTTKLKATWLGHACFLVELPAPKEGGRGITFLLDPAFSHQCFPIQSTWLGPKGRYTPVPCSVTELPEIDAIVISHNHYDHMDLFTLKDLYARSPSRPPTLFIPLRNTATLQSTLPSSAKIIEMDWWDESEFVVEGKGSAKVICTPAQHTCSRIGIDRDKALWSSWALQSITSTGQKGASAWFGGDTGYSYVDKDIHTIDPSYPICPAFTEIGERAGPFTLGLIPIGAYAPRHLMSPAHNAPIDAVRMFKDVKCKQAIAMHWGTWRMALDRIAEPPLKLEEARKEVGMSENEFSVCAIGETRAYDP
ncbi:beta-lactamase superfamily domain-domain-containing protein [Naematelia encephala]|uniref:Beta-lactamase superfamily domain-domain-containing protein n=1 Tax=Naematelia encephala TaxID=71784 RepID=A0A1Y2ADT6_9TREE|nr:beta-lactamase superfamily domain-domain-containing protein [Naematelia encephala]